MPLVNPGGSPLGNTQKLIKEKHAVQFYGLMLERVWIEKENRPLLMGEKPAGKGKFVIVHTLPFLFFPSGILPGKLNESEWKLMGFF